MPQREAAVRAQSAYGTFRPATITLFFGSVHPVHQRREQLRSRARRWRCPSTARALRGIQPDGADPATPVFGLTGETLANRVRAAARAAGLGDGFSGHSGRIGMARRMVAAGASTAAVQHQGRWKHGDMVTRYTQGEAAGEALKWLT